MKYKAGSKVRIRKDLEVGKFYGGLGFILDMEKYCGKEAEITIVRSSYYNLDIDDCNWYWTDEMLEPFKKTLDNLEEGDIVVNENGEEKMIFGVHGRICHTSGIDNFEEVGFDYTPEELREYGFKLKDQEEETVTVKISKKTLDLLKEQGVKVEK